MKKETWKDVVGYEGLYAVSSEGRIKRLCDVKHCMYGAGDIIPLKNVKGYCTIKLLKNKIRKELKVHRLALIAFIGACPAGKEGSHLNDIKDDNRIENLCWMTPSENIKQAYINGRKRLFGKDNPNFGNRLSEEKRKERSIAYTGKDGPFYGKTHSVEARKKISKSMKGKKNALKK